MGRALAKLEQEAAESIQAKAAKATGSNCSLIEHQAVEHGPASSPANGLGSPQTRSNGAPLPGDPPDTEEV